MPKPTLLGQVMTRSEATELVATVRSLTGDDIEARAVAIAAGWPLGVGPTMADDTAAKRRQLEVARLAREADALWADGDKRGATKLHERRRELEAEQKEGSDG